jgi:exo-1,4-beta-D-glucosaminidase
MPDFDWKRTNVVSTPVTAYGDMTRLLNLPKVHLKATARLHRTKNGDTVRVCLNNRSASLAFQVRLLVGAEKSGEEILPVLWQDNYVSLLPGEELSLDACFPGKRSIGSQPIVTISGWNIEPATLVLGRRLWRDNLDEKVRQSRD